MMNTALEIKKVSHYPLELPLKAAFGIATSTLPAINNLAVAIELAGGVKGWGEVPILPPVTTENRETARSILAQEDQILPGSNAGDWRTIAGELQERLPEYAAVRCGLEMAVLDAFLQHSRIPLFRFLGGESDSVVTDITIPICSAEEAEHLARQYKELGFRTIKMKVGIDIAGDLERIIAVKRVFRGSRLIVDVNTGYTLEQTLEFLTELKSASIMLDLLEQPLHRDDREGMGRLAREASVPIAADESCRSPEDARQIVNEGLAQVINIKLAKCGVVQALEIADIARNGNIDRMIGGMVETRIAMGFSAHFAAGLGGFDWIDLDTPLLLAHDPVAGGYIAEGPRYKLDTGSYGHGGHLVTE